MVLATEVKDSFHAKVLAARHGDTGAYSKAVHQYENEPYQDAWQEALQTLNRTAIVCPPDTYKSTTVRHFVEREIGRDRNTGILWIMNAGSQAIKHAMTVQATIEGNSVYRAAFPDVKEDPSKQWTKEVLYVERDDNRPDPTFMAAGWNGPYQGLHFPIIVLDDLTNQEDVRSETTMELQENKLRGVILDRLTEDGRIVAIFTRWGSQDLYRVYKDLGFTIIEMPVVGDYPWGPTLSNKRFSPERIERLRRDKGDYLFNLTYMCNPAAVEGHIIKREHLLYWDKSNLPDTPLQMFMGIDPASSVNPKADRSAIITVGADFKNRPNIYVMNAWAGRMEVPDLEMKIVREAQQTSGLRGIGLETVGFQMSLMQYMKRRHQLPFKEIPYRSRRQAMHKAVGIDKGKIGRALYLEQLFTEGRLFLPKEGLPLVEGMSLESELLTFTGRNDPMDDRLDALAIACVIAETSIRPKIPLHFRGF